MWPWLVRLPSRPQPVLVRLPIQAFKWRALVSVHRSLLLPRLITVRKLSARALARCQAPRVTFLTRVYRSVWLVSGQDRRVVWELGHAPWGVAPVATPLSAGFLAAG